MLWLFSVTLHQLQHIQLRTTVRFLFIKTGCLVGRIETQGEQEPQSSSSGPLTVFLEVLRGF